MTHTEKLHLLQEWANEMQACDACIDSIGDALGLHPESPLNTAVWALQAAYTRSVAQHVGDGAEDWLGWYAHENDFGRKNMRAGIEGDMQSIKTTEQLLWAIKLKAEK